MKFEITAIHALIVFFVLLTRLLLGLLVRAFVASNGGLSLAFE